MNEEYIYLDFKSRNGCVLSFDEDILQLTKNVVCCIKNTGKRGMK